jgi:6,7-dimethyl-8-ribityllumazine synthase
MSPVFAGHLDAKGFKIALVASRWNDVVTSRLVEAATDALLRHGADEKQIDLVRVPDRSSCRRSPRSSRRRAVTTRSWRSGA